MSTDKTLTAVAARSNPDSVALQRIYELIYRRDPELDRIRARYGFRRHAAGAELPTAPEMQDIDPRFDHSFQIPSSVREVLDQASADMRALYAAQQK